MEMKFENIIEEIRIKISEINNLTDEKTLEFIEDFIFTKDEYKYVTNDERHYLIKRIFYSLRKEMDILEIYIKDPKVTEIMVNGKSHIFIEKEGKISKSKYTFEETQTLEDVIRRAAHGVNKEINDLNPIVDARLKDGSRINGVYKNIAIDGPVLTIRKFPQKALTMRDLITFNTITKEAANFLEKLVKAGYNIFISGGTSSGKTTFLNVLSEYIPRRERVIVIEDSAELQIKNIDNIVRLECKNANTEGKGLVEMRDLIKTSLRMRPDRIIVGEIRGKEVVDMLQGCNTGHDGSMSTGHGNSVTGIIRRLEALFLQSANFPISAVRSQIGEGINIIVHLGKLRDKGRKVMEISELLLSQDNLLSTNILFKYSEKNGLTRTENKIVNTEKLELYFGEKYESQL